MKILFPGVVSRVGVVTVHVTGPTWSYTTSSISLQLKRTILSRPSCLAAWHRQGQETVAETS